MKINHSNGNFDVSPKQIPLIVQNSMISQPNIPKPNSFFIQLSPSRQIQQNNLLNYPCVGVVQQQKTLIKNLSAASLQSSKPNLSPLKTSTILNSSHQNNGFQRNIVGQNINHTYNQVPPKFQLSSTSSILEKLNEKKVQPPKVVTSSANARGGKKHERENIVKIGSPKNQGNRKDQTPNKDFEFNQFRKDGGFQLQSTIRQNSKEQILSRNKSELQNEKETICEDKIEEQKKAETTFYMKQNSNYNLGNNNNKNEEQEVKEQINLIHLKQLEMNLKIERKRCDELGQENSQLKEQNDRLQRLNRDLTLQNTSLVNNQLVDNINETKVAKQLGTSKLSENQSDSSTLQDDQQNNYVKCLETECNKLQLLLEHRNMEVQAWMHKFVEQQQKKEIKEESESYLILKKQSERDQDTIKRLEEQINSFEIQKRSKEEIIQQLKDEISSLKVERDTWMNKYSVQIKENSLKSQGEQVESATLKVQCEELTSRNIQLNDQLTEQIQFLQEQRGWTDHWKEKALSIENKVEEITRTEIMKSQQKYDEYESKILQLTHQNQQIKANSILEAQIQSNQKLEKLQSEYSNLQNENRDLLNKIQFLENNIKNLKDEKESIHRETAEVREEVTSLKIQLEKKSGENENQIQEKVTIIEQLKKQNQQDQMREISLRQSLEIDNLKVKSRVAQLEAEIGSCKIELEKSISRTKDYQRELDTWSKKCESIEKTHKLQIDELNQHHANFKQQNYEREVKASKMEVEGKLFYLDNQVKILTKEISIWREKCLAQETEYEESFRSRSSELADLQQKLSFATQKHMNTLNEVNEKCDKEMKQQIQKNSDLHNQVKILQSQLDQSQQENIVINEQSEKRIKELQDLLQSTQQDNRQKGTTQLDQRIKSLEKQIDDLQTRKQVEQIEQNRQISLLEQNISDSKDKISQYIDRIKELESFIKSKEDESIQMNKQSHIYNKQMVDFKNEIDSLKAELESKTSACEFLLSENESLQINILKYEID